MKTLVVRFRGIGDVLLSWFGLESLAKTQDVIYCTSPQSAQLFPVGWVEVVPYSWKEHPLNPFPELPVMEIPHDKLINLVNAVDFREHVPDYDTVSRARQFARLMGVTPSDYVRPVVPIDMDYGYSIMSPYVLCQTDAMAPTRHWSYWTHLSRILLSRGIRVLWCGDKEKEAPVGVLNQTGRTSLNQWVSLLWHATVIVSPCTSAVHIGARIPHAKVIGLYGSTDYRLFTEFYTNVIPISSYSLACSPCADWQRAHACYQQAYMPWCLNLISPNYVAKKVMELMETPSVGPAYHHTESSRVPSMGTREHL